MNKQASKEIVLIIVFEILKILLLFLQICVFCFNFYLMWYDMLVLYNLNQSSEHPDIIL